MNQVNPRTIRPSAAIKIAESANPPPTIQTSVTAPQTTSAQVIFRQYRKFAMPNHLFFERLT